MVVKLQCKLTLDVVCSMASKQAGGKTIKRPRNMSGEMGNMEADSNEMLMLLRKLEAGQKGLESKVDKLRNDIMKSVDSQLKKIRDEFVLDIARLDTKLTGLENLVERQHENRNGAEVNPLDDNELCIIAANIPAEVDEDLHWKVSEIVGKLSGTANFTIVKAVRLRSRRQGSPGLVKFAVESVEQKIQILRKKYELKNDDRYNKVFLRASKSHTERLLELNARTILNELPNGSDFRITGSGCIVKKTKDDPLSSRAPRNTDHEDIAD